MHSHLQIEPISINPENRSDSSLSPINCLNGKLDTFNSALKNKSEFLKSKIKELKSHIENKKKHGKVIREEISRQEQKIYYWKNNFQQMEDDYSKKMEKLHVLRQKLNPKKPVSRMKCDTDDEGSTNRLRVMLKPKKKNTTTQVPNQFKRIKSIIKDTKTMKRGPNLSLTHLHRVDII